MQHPIPSMIRLMDWAKTRGYFNITVDIETSTPVSLPSGQETHLWEPVEDHEQIDAHIAPVQGPEEVKRADGTTVTNGRIVTLKGYYPAIELEHSVLVGTTRYGIIAIMHDGQRAYTKLAVEEVT